MHKLPPKLSVQLSIIRPHLLAFTCSACNERSSISKDTIYLSENLSHEVFMYLTSSGVQGFLAPGTDTKPIVPALEKIWADSMGQSMANFNFRLVTSKFNELVYQYPIRIPERFALVIRCPCKHLPPSLSRGVPFSPLLFLHFLIYIKFQHHLGMGWTDAFRGGAAGV